MKGMQKIPAILFLIFIFIFPFGAEAQLVNRIKRAAERGVANAVEKKVETEAQKLAMRQLEKMFQNLYGDDFENQAGVDFSKIMSGINANVETADNYDFSGYALMEMKSTDEKGKSTDPMDIRSFFSDNASILAMEMLGNENKGKEDGKMIMIYDFDRNASVILMENDGEKSRMAYGFDFEKMSEGIKTEETEDMEENPDFKIEKTGNTKTINGYTCEEYRMDNEDATVHYWITDNPINENISIWGQNNPMINAKMKNQNHAYYQNLPKGNILEMFFESKKDKSSAEILVKEINDNETVSFVMADYQNVFQGAEK